MAEEARMRRSNGNYKLSMGTEWPTERWVAVVVLLALGILIALRMGFRGVSFAGASARIG